MEQLKRVYERSYLATNIRKMLQEEFSRDTDAGKVGRLPYKHWKKFMASASGCCSITVQYNKTDKILFFRYPDGEHIYAQSVTVDTGFAKWFYDREVKYQYASPKWREVEGRDVLKINKYGDIYDSNESQKPKTYVTSDGLEIDLAKIEKVTSAIKRNNKENENMKGFNFDFGPCTGDNVKISMYGLAVKNAAGTWVSYNKEAGQIIDVDIMNFDGGQFLFKMPVAIKDVAEGDIVIHNRVPMFITGIGEDGKMTAVDVHAGEEKFIIPTRNMFGFDFVTKIISVIDAVGNAPTPDQPFGNMLPFMMMTGDAGEIDPMMMMLMMNGGKGFDMSNPMMLYFMMDKSGGKNDMMLPMLMMMNQK